MSLSAVPSILTTPPSAPLGLRADGPPESSGVGLFLSRQCSGPEVHLSSALHLQEVLMTTDTQV